jgi:outer membrane protein insertion porin family
MDVPGEKFEAMREAGIHFHAFANVGALLPIAAVPSAPKDLARVMRDSARVSLGVGVVWPLPIGQIEINYGKVVRAGAHDRVKDGFQVGIASHVSM